MPKNECFNKIFKNAFRQKLKFLTTFSSFIFSLNCFGMPNADSNSNPIGPEEFPKDFFINLITDKDNFALLGLTKFNTAADIQVMGELWQLIYEGREKLEDMDRVRRRQRYIAHNGLGLDPLRHKYINDLVRLKMDAVLEEQNIGFKEALREALQKEISMSGVMPFDLVLLVKSLHELAGELPKLTSKMRLSHINGLVGALSRVESFCSDPKLTPILNEIYLFLGAQIFPVLGNQFGSTWAKFFNRVRHFNPRVVGLFHLNPEKSRMVADGLLDFLSVKSLKEFEEQAWFFSTIFGAEQVDHYWARLSERISGRSQYDSRILEDIDFHDLLNLSDKLRGMRAKLASLELASKKVWGKRDAHLVWQKILEIKNGPNQRSLIPVSGFVWDRKRYPSLEMSEDEMLMEEFRIKKNFKLFLGESIVDELEDGARAITEEEDFFTKRISPRKMRESCKIKLRKSLKF